MNFLYGVTSTLAMTLLFSQMMIWRIATKIIVWSVSTSIMILSAPSIFFPKISDVLFKAALNIITIISIKRIMSLSIFQGLIWNVQLWFAKRSHYHYATVLSDLQEDINKLTISIKENRPKIKKFNNKMIKDPEKAVEMVKISLENQQIEFQHLILSNIFSKCVDTLCVLANLNKSEAQRLIGQARHLNYNGT